MAKAQRNFICQNCGTVHRKWTGKCDGCNEWNTISEDIVEAAVPKGMSIGKGRKVELFKLEGENHETLTRHKSNMDEFDRVTGGGLVPGSALLIGGDPGIGKSTLLLQIVCRLSLIGKRCAYFSGEEAVDQVRLRASRLGVTGTNVDLASANNVRDIIATIEGDAQPYDLVVIDSIQTMFVDSVDSAPGTVTQVRTSAQELIRVAKRKGICLMLVGHVTKEGQIAGPRILEHMVDTVLYFEGDRGHPFRILRTVKNRFGATDEIGVFEMAHEGLVEVTNPSEIFLSQRQENVPGSAVLAGLEGSRPVLVEVQALVAPTALPSPRRAVIGWDQNRLAMVLAVIETRCGIQFSGCDVFLNVAGGIRISEPAADAAVAAALISAHLQRPLPEDLIVFGEIGLSGEVRQVSQPDLRLKEAAKLGFKQALCPRAIKKKGKKAPDLNIKRNELGSTGDIMLYFADHTEKLAS
jgi:DNA repair protein RadA/Sms